MSTLRTEWAFQNVWNWEQNTRKKCVFYIIAGLRQFSSVCVGFTSALQHPLHRGNNFRYLQLSMITADLGP